LNNFVRFGFVGALAFAVQAFCFGQLEDFKAKEPKTPMSFSGRASKPMVVDWSYLRMHQPEVVQAFLRQAKSGKIPMAKLGGLATEREIATMVQNVSSEETPPLRPALTVAKQVSDKPLVKLGSYSAIAPKIAQQTVLPLVDLGSRSQQDNFQGYYETVANADGNVTVTITAGGWHSIFVYTYTGTGLSGGSRQIEKQASVTGTQLTFPVRAGQGFSIYLSSPFGTGPGDTSCTFTAFGGGLNLTGSFVGHFLQNLIRITPLSPSGMISSVSGATMTFNVTNDSPDTKIVEVSQASLPRGVSAGSQQFTLAPHQSQVATIGFGCDQTASLGPNQMAQITAQASTTNINYPQPIFATCPVWLNVFQPFTVFTDHGSAGKVDCTFTITLGANGLCQWQGALHDNSTWYGDCFQLAYYLTTPVAGSDHIGNRVFSVLGAQHSGPSVDFAFNYSGTMDDIRNRWDKYVNSGFVWNLSVDGDLTSAMQSCENWVTAQGVHIVP
jgi:hypothetical protein